MNKRAIMLLLGIVALAGILAGCTTPKSSKTTSSSPSVPSPSPTVPASPQQPAAEPSTPSGDVPDNAVFLSYESAAGGYSLQYVEGWVVNPQTDGGVEIRDKDSSEIVQLMPLPAASDLMPYVQQTDLPKVQAASTGFQRTQLTTVSVHGQNAVKLTYTWLSRPDAVTGKNRAVTSDRYYLPGPKQLAVLTLTTPIGVDNVDAFNQILGSFAWK
jgi:hypothetical protein